MAILIAFALLVGACYSPDAASCTHACTANSDCVSDQTCNADRMCAAPSVSHCNELDAGTDGHASGVGDAAPPDATPIATLAIHVDGPGSVTCSNGESCAVGDCTFHVAPNIVTTLTASPHLDKMFDHWESVACMGQPAICQLVPPTGATAVAAKFH